MSARSSPELTVLTVNNTFYQAMQSLDLGQMEAVWWHDDWVRCLHPGWDLLLGWDAVRESWEMIFSSTAKMNVTISRPLVHVLSDAAWVSCVEHATSAVESDFITTLVEATNIFVRRNSQWRMVHHHTTPLTGRVPAATSRTVQ
jgi:hypothetical protein